MKSSGPRTGRSNLMLILEAPVLGRKQPGVHGNEKALKKDPSPEGNWILTFRSKCGTPTPGEPLGDLSGQVSVRTIREDRSFGIHHQRSKPPGLSEWPPSGAPTLGPIPGTESPRNRV
jgi:hypothetical protein